jgi:hypothetical protein
LGDWSLLDHIGFIFEAIVPTVRRLDTWEAHAGDLAGCHGTSTRNKTARQDFARAVADDVAAGRHCRSTSQPKSFSVFITMKVIRYSVVIDPDVRFSKKEFARDIAIYLSDPNGWESKGYEFEEVESNPEVVIHMTSPAGLLKVGCEADLSCAELGGKHMRVNSMRWTTGAEPSKLDLANYRQYLVSHEMGHILGHDHTKCPGPGQPAPVMMQQTRGVGKCKPNTRV